MTKEAQLFDGTVLEFPDTTPDDVIQRVAKQQTASRRGAPPAGGNNLETLIRGNEHLPDQQQHSTAADVGLSVASGVPRGIVETAMTPITLNRAAEGVGSYLFDKAEGPVRSALGMDPAVPGPDHDRVKDFILNPLTGAANYALRTVSGDENADVRQGPYVAQDAVRGAMDSTLHTPETRLGKYAGTFAEFLAPGGLPSKGARLAETGLGAIRKYGSEAIGNVVAPAIISETAGQATEGTPYEGVSRFLGALFGNAGAAGARVHNAPENIVRRATGDVTDAQWQRARELQANTTGVKLTGPEAIGQATDGASALTNVQRIVEGSVDGRARTGAFFAQRPGQVDAAVNNTLDQIAPQHPQPSTLGPAVATAAERAVGNTPPGQALADAVHGTGPRTTAMQAGEDIQGALRRIFDRRDGMRDALADQDYTAARAAQPGIDVGGLQPETVAANRPVYSIRPTAADEAAGAPAAMTPQRVDQPPQPIALESRTGANAVQVDPRPVLRYIDQALVNARGTTADALTTVRGGIMGPNGADTGVTGLDNLRGNINSMISRAVQEGDGQTAEALRNVQGHLDGALESVPEYAAARQGFRAASVPVQPFENPAMNDVIRRDQFNRNFVTPPERVPGTISAGGPTAAREFNSVAPTDARIAFENHLATQILDKATDASGRVNGDMLSTALRDNQDMLSQYPAMAARLQRIIGANADMAPVRASPLGQVAAAKDTTGAGNAILPQNPLTGSAGEAGDAARRLAAEDPATTAALVRQNLADRHTKASTDSQEGTHEYAGAKFRKDVAGNGTRQEVLDAVLRSLPADKASVSMPELLDVLQATGRRKPVGSATEFNRATNADLGDASPTARAIAVATSLGRSLFTNAGDAVRRKAMRDGLGTLADMFIAPNSVDLIRNARNNTGGRIAGAAAMRTAAAAGGTLNERSPR
ncbi:hypothetical protein [Mesorhizobium sp. INR15]|uniref:hypothetical protein n=1 Tax=Mesorhizobium sp. INR15 TaxID=2654248 RepID=UPI0018964005|nr:hypothetical protein [Mesorhizobium sp. INR15]QPC90016.1 hypothetical protein GA829_05095 [Mesorhizobium sp. INR15]